MAELERNQRTRPWWANRVEARELLELSAGDPAAAPEWERPQVVRGILSGPAQRRRQAVGAMLPVRRERPVDLEGTAQGETLYGARRAVGSPYRLMGPGARVPADSLGVKLRYAPLEGRAARVTGIRCQRVAGGALAAGTLRVQVARGSIILPLYVLAATDTAIATPFVLQPGDELQFEQTIAGDAGAEWAIITAVEQWT